MNTVSTKKYAFVLGRERELCFAELRAVLDRFDFCFSDLILANGVAFANLDRSPEKLINVFGGVTKIFEIVLTDSKNTKELIKKIVTTKTQDRSGKFIFGLSSYVRNNININSLNTLGLSIKKELKSALSLRFVALKDHELSTVVSSKSKLASDGLEIGFFDGGIGVLIAVTDPEAWSERDYGKPAGDKRSGMLPPKLARIMVNLALGAITNNQEAITKKIQNTNIENSLKIEKCPPAGGLKISQAPLVADPFCGSGNVLIEALMLGCDVYGSDVSEKAVKDSKANVDWLINKFSIVNSQLSIKSEKQNYEIKKLDTTNDQFIENCKLKIENYDRAVVVAEPYLGEPKKFKPSMNAARGEYLKVKELYLDFFRNIAKLSFRGVADEKSHAQKDLSPFLPSANGGQEMARDDKTGLVLCLVFPLVETIEGKQYSLYQESVDEIKKIGYTPLQLPLVYGRDYQVVKRQIVLLQLT